MKRCLCTHISKHIHTNKCTYIHTYQQTSTDAYTKMHTTSHKNPQSPSSKAARVWESIWLIESSSKKKKRKRKAFATLSNSLWKKNILTELHDVVSSVMQMWLHQNLYHDAASSIFFGVDSKKKSLQLVLLLKNLSIQFRNWLTQKLRPDSKTWSKVQIMCCRMFCLTITTPNTSL